MWGLARESPRPHIHRFRPQARAPPLGVSLPHQRCGDGEVSGSGVSEGVCEAPTFMEWSTMVVPTYPEGGSHALQVCMPLPSFPGPAARRLGPEHDAQSGRLERVTLHPPP